MTDLEGAVERVVLEAAERMHADLGSDLSWPEEIPPSRDWLIGLARLALEPILPRDTMGIGSREFYVLESASWSRIAKAQQERATKAETALASITRERDEAREISRIMTRFYPSGENAHRDNKLTQALLAVPSPSDRAALVNGEVG